MIEVLVSIVIVKAPGHQHPQYWLSIFYDPEQFLSNGYCWSERTKKRLEGKMLCHLKINSLAPGKFEWNLRHVIFK